MEGFNLHLSVVSVDNVSPLRGRAAPLQHAVAPYRRQLACAKALWPNGMSSGRTVGGRPRSEHSLRNLVTSHSGSAFSRRS